MDPKTEDNATFYTLVYAGLMLLGGFAGTLIAARLVPDSHAVAVVAAVMLPLGVVAGLSFGQKKMPPGSLLSLMTIFDGRHTVEQMMARNGGGGAMTLATSIVGGTIVVCLAAAFLVDVAIKPPVEFMELATWFGCAGLAFGIVSGAVLFFMTE